MELLSAVLFLNFSEADSWFEAAHFPLRPLPLWSPQSLSSLCFGHNRRRYPADILCQKNWLFKTDSLKLFCRSLDESVARFEGGREVSEDPQYQNMSG